MSLPKLVTKQVFLGGHLSEDRYTPRFAPGEQLHGSPFGDRTRVARVVTAETSGEGI